MNAKAWGAGLGGVLIGLIAGFAWGATSATTHDTNSAITAPTTQAPTPAPTQATTLATEDYLERVYVYVSEPNSAGGVDVQICVRNEEPETIKYLVFDVVPYNAVDDIVSSEIGGKSQARLKYTGPLDRFTTDSAGWANVWYNSTIVRADVVGVAIEYMDGTVVRTVGTEASGVVASSDPNRTLSDHVTRCNA